ncbi:uncharacterized protein EV154DRAFT_499742 [Mucor mucedo]|uniref:uncharacterized protein n=1 Tax=Mucor mucedo TaxID=29922 RepID=UPI0022201310|nr:uncharacterized protein EV154DRAFT_499742 [Mucor mucedo]KAI7893964.1 hypothetical protein EV154DRAFT_499742 [Mucor mucedo]
MSFSSKNQTKLSKEQENSYYNFWSKVEEKPFSFNSICLTTETVPSAPNKTGKPSPVELVRPLLIGVEKNSVLIEITHIKEPQLLLNALQSFNAGKEEGAEYRGRLQTFRRYLDRSYLETVWTMGSHGRNTILNEGIILSDGTFVKGFLSLTDKDQLIHVELHNLPFLPLLSLKYEMEIRLRFFGDILDLGVFKRGGCFTGLGYAILNITPTLPNSKKFEPLPDGGIPWITDDDEEWDRYVNLKYTPIKITF